MEPELEVTLHALLKLLKQGGEEKKVRREILVALGLTGCEDERINLTTFRRLIGNNFKVDGSYIYRQVYSALDRRRKNGYLTADQMISLMYTLQEGPFQDQVDLGLRVYGKPAQDTPEDELDNISRFVITYKDAILSIVESLQLCSPRAVHTLNTNKREKAYRIGEDLVAIIFPKLDVDKDGVISRSDFSRVCHDDPTLLQVFGQYLPRDNLVQPSPVYEDISLQDQVIGAVSVSQSHMRPRTSLSRGSFEDVDYLKHSPTFSRMWGRQGQEAGKVSAENVQMPVRLEPIPVAEVKAKAKTKAGPSSKKVTATDTSSNRKLNAGRGRSDTLKRR